MELKHLDIFNDYKSILQELVQTDRRSLEYIVVNEEGPAHNKVFTVVVKIGDIIYGKGSAHSKKEAEQNAAKDALDKAKGIFGK
jgi:ribonuclease-3